MAVQERRLFCLIHPIEILPAKAGDPNPPAHLTRLADRARDYAKASSSATTRRAYASDWRHFESWSRRAGLEPRPDPQTIGLYLAASAEAACAAGAGAICVGTAITNVDAQVARFVAATSS